MTVVLLRTTQFVGLALVLLFKTYVIFRTLSTIAEILDLIDGNPSKLRRQAKMGQTENLYFRPLSLNRVCCVIG